LNLFSSTYSHMYWQFKSNINSRDVQRQDGVNFVDMSSLRAPWEWPVQIPTHRTTQKRVENEDATDV